MVSTSLAWRSVIVLQHADLFHRDEASEPEKGSRHVDDQGAVGELRPPPPNGEAAHAPKADHEEPDQPMAGRRSAHGWAASNAAEAASTVRSAKRRPTICRPTGSLLEVIPTGTVAAGWPVRLNGNVNGIQPSGDTCCPSIALTPGRPTSNGGTATVGMSRRSKRARKRCTSVQNSWRRRAAAR